MSKLKTHDNIAESKKKIIAVRDELDTAYLIMQNLQSSLKTTKWKGEHKEHFEAILDIVLQYHLALSESGSELAECIQVLDDKVGAYPELNSVVKLKGIE